MGRKQLSTRRKKKQKRRQQKGLVFALFGLGLVILSVFLIGRSQQPAVPLAANDILARGEQLYAQNCAVCHNSNGEGHAQVQEAPALNGNEHAWHHADGQLQRIILEGGQIMPAFREQLSLQDSAAIIRYIQTWWSASQLDSQQSLSKRDPLQQ